MSLTLTIECDVTNCSNKAKAAGRNPEPITSSAQDFDIDQPFELPDGWTRTDDLSEAPEGLHLCPEHCASDVGIVAEIRAVKAGMHR
jgi:hypothetical protein